MAALHSDSQTNIPHIAFELSQFWIKKNKKKKKTCKIK